MKISDYTPSCLFCSFLTVEDLACNGKCVLLICEKHERIITNPLEICEYYDPPRRLREDD